MKAFQVLKDSPICKGMDQKKIDAIAEICEPIKLQNGDLVFNEGDSGDTLFIVDSGNIKIFKAISSYYEETLAHIGRAGVFGEMSFIDLVSRSSSATATQRSDLFSLSRSKFDELMEDPTLGLELLDRLSRIISDRIRITNDKYKEAVIWGQEIMRLTSLSFEYLIQNKIDVEVSFSNEQTLRGQIVNLGQGETGKEVTLKDAQDRLYLIPYYSILCLRLDSALIRSFGSAESLQKPGG
jgi:CRP-like cAMP-binding protein